MSARIAALYFYPVKSAGGLELEQARLTRSGISNDRRWMVVAPGGRFITQREAPRLALLRPYLSAAELVLSTPGKAQLRVALEQRGARVPVEIWKDRCPGLDEGEAAAQWLGEVLGRECRLVRFDPQHRRLSAHAWTGELDAENLFSDGFPLLVIARESLADLNSRLKRVLPMNRFRPNIVLEGISPYDEDRIDELYGEGLRLKLVKPCTRCRITTTDQDTAELDGQEPLRTLKSYRFNAQLHGVVFGQNAVIVEGTNAVLRRGQMLEVRWKQTVQTAVG
jgi:MOSC domain-containing protein